MYKCIIHCESISENTLQDICSIYTDEKNEEKSVWDQVEGSYRPSSNLQEQIPQASFQPKKPLAFC